MGTRLAGDTRRRRQGLFRVLWAVLLLALLPVGQGAAQEASLGVPPRVAPNTAFEVEWQGPGAPGDFIAVAELGAPAASFLVYARTSGGSPSVLTAPAAGQYELRYVRASDLSVLAKAALRVGEDTQPAALVAPARVTAGSALAVSVPDPGDPADYVTIVESGAPDQAFGPYARLGGADKVSLTAPEAPGAYEIRHVEARRMTVLARAPLEVRPAPAAAGASASKETAEAEGTGAEGTEAEGTGEEETGAAAAGLPRRQLSLTALVAVDRAHDFRVAWTRDGGTDALHGSRIDIVPRGAGPEAAVSSRPASDGPPIPFTAPDRPGEYEILLVDEASGEVLATRALEVR